MAGAIYHGVWASRPQVVKIHVGETPTLLVKICSPASSPSTTSAPPRKSADSSAGFARTIRIQTPQPPTVTYRRYRKPSPAPNPPLPIQHPKFKIQNPRPGPTAFPIKLPSSANSSATTTIRSLLLIPKRSPPTSVGRTKNAPSRSKGFWRR